MSHVLHRQLATTPPRAVSASGMYIVDEQGRRFLDACGGAAVSCLGHGHPDVLAAMHAQIDRLVYAHTSFFTSEVSESLADHLVEHAPAVAPTTVSAQNAITRSGPICWKAASISASRRAV